MSTVISAPAILVNNEVVPIVPNSFEFDEGLGEQTIRAASAGGGSVEQVYSENVEMNFSEFKFQIYPDARSIELARQWKSNRNQNVVEVAGKAPDGTSIERTFQNASLPANYKVPLGADTDIELGWKSDAAV